MNVYLHIDMYVNHNGRRDLSMKHRKRSLLLLSATLMSTALLGTCMSGCGKKNPLREGDCVLNVSMIDLPKEFQLQEKNILEHTAVYVTLQNTTTGKEYPFSLNADNTYSQKLSLYPGTYKITKLEGATDAYDYIEYMADAGEVTLVNKDMPMQLSVFIGNPEAFNSHWKEIQPLPEIQLEDLFSCKIQWRREMISLYDLPKRLAWNEVVKPGESATLSTDVLGINLTVKNSSGEALPATECDLIKAEFTMNNVVFPKGVTIGMDPADLFHNQEGYYGEPTHLSGSIFFGKKVAPLKATYEDVTTGTKVTLTADSDGEYITGILFEPGPNPEGKPDVSSEDNTKDNTEGTSEGNLEDSTEGTSEEGGDRS